MEIDRVWAMPNKWTFQIPEVAEIIYQYVGEGKGWIDPFAGETSPAEITNDLNPERPTTFHLDALEFLKSIPDNSANGVLYDPPYSMRQASEAYKGVGKQAFIVTNKNYWSRCKIEISRIVKPGGIVICCGWNSNGIGKKRGFKLEKLRLIGHGGAINDTIVTVERKFTTEINFNL